MSGWEGQEAERRFDAAAAADGRRFEEVNGLPAAVTGVASSPDGSVTVEVGMGGGLRSVRLGRQALSRGGAALAATVLEVAERATAKANQRAQFAFRNALGGSAAAVLDEIGLGYDPELTEEPDTGEQSHLQRGWR